MITKAMNLDKGEYYAVSDTKASFNDFIGKYIGHGLFGNETFVTEMTILGGEREDWGVTQGIIIGKTTLIRHIPKKNIGRVKIKTETLVSKPAKPAKTKKIDKVFEDFKKSPYATRGKIEHYKFIEKTR